MNILAILGVVALVIAIIGGIFGILEQIEKRTGSHVLRWVLVPFVRLRQWIGSPREDIKKLQAEIADIKKLLREHIDLSKSLTERVLEDQDRISDLEKRLSELQSEQEKEALAVRGNLAQAHETVEAVVDSMDSHKKMLELINENVPSSIENLSKRITALEKGFWPKPKA